MKPQFILVANPESNRVAFFQAALERVGFPAARVISWADLIQKKIDLRQVVQKNTIVRIESPGRDFEVERLLLAVGADLDDKEGSYNRLSYQDCLELAFDRGRILYPRQWYLGFCHILNRVSEQLADSPQHIATANSSDIQTMFDKCKCHAHLASQNITVPKSIGPISDFNGLTKQMQDARWNRVFLKLAHGSSASGVVAYQTNGEQHSATTTTEMALINGELRLYNSRQLRTYRNIKEIATLIDSLCRHRVHVEQWLPKAGIADHTFDLRVIVIGGKAMHTVARMSRSPLTNLHLLNRRGDIQAIQTRMGTHGWASAMETCEDAMQTFPQSFMGGVDLLISPDFQHHAILEVNAFGDLLPNILHNGFDSYEAQIQAIASQNFFTPKNT